MYPSWRYHATYPARVVNSPFEDEQLGDDWSHTPATFNLQVEAAPGPLTPQAQGIPSQVTEAEIKRAEEAAIAKALEAKRRGQAPKGVDTKAPAKDVTAKPSK